MRDLLLPAAIRRLKHDTVISPGGAATTFTAAVFDDLGFDLDSGAYKDGWLFQGLDGEGNPYRQVEGSGKAAVVLHTRSPGSAPRQSGAAYPVLTVLVYADATRRLDGTLVTRDAEARALRVFEWVDRFFNDVGNNQHWWSINDRPLYVAAATRESEPAVDDVPKSECTVRINARYSLILG